MLRRVITCRCAAPPIRVIRVGDWKSEVRVFTRDDVRTFAKLSGDQNPIHVDDAAARRLGFERAICHGALVASMFSDVMARHLPGPNSVYVHQTLNFTAPVLVDEEVECIVHVLCFRRDKGMIRMETVVKRTRDGVVAIKGHSIGLNKEVKLEGESPPWIK